MSADRFSAQRVRAVFLKEFQQILRDRLTTLWPAEQTQAMTVVGYGFAAPLLRPYLARARRVRKVAHGGRAGKIGQAAMQVLRGTEAGPARFSTLSLLKTNSVVEVPTSMPTLPITSLAMATPFPARSGPACPSVASCREPR